MTPRQTLLNVSLEVFNRHVFTPSEGKWPQFCAYRGRICGEQWINAVLEFSWGQGHSRLSSLFAQSLGHLFLSRSLLSSSQSLSGENTLRTQVWPTCANPIPPEIDQETQNMNRERSDLKLPSKALEPLSPNTTARSVAFTIMRQLPLALANSN